jgi:hypothetical protein
VRIRPARELSTEDRWGLPLVAAFVALWATYVAGAVAGWW